jgi:hypothetical protein
MQTQPHGEHSLDAIGGLVAGLRQQLESGQQESWEKRLSSMQEWICELLIENQQLRMSSASRTNPGAF